MSVAVRELRNNTAAVVERVRKGEVVYLSVNGQRVARIDPVDAYLKPYLSRDEVMALPQADAGLRDDLAAMGSDDTDMVGPLKWQ